MLKQAAEARPVNAPETKVVTAEENPTNTSALSLSSNFTLIRLTCAQVDYSDLFNCMVVCKAWNQCLNEFDFPPLFLESLNFRVKKPLTAIQALRVLHLFPEHTDKKAQRIFLELFMHFDGAANLDQLHLSPDYYVSKLIDDRLQVRLFSYTQPPFSTLGWYLLEYYKDIPEEQEISPIDEQDLDSVIL